MDVSEPSRCVIPTLEGPVLDVLARTRAPLAGREVARLARAGSEAGVRLALHRLVDQGVVLAHERGGAVFYELNHDHLAFPAIQILVGLRRELLDRLIDLFPTWAVPPLHASLFGSAARRDGDTRSDIDVLLIHADEIDEDSEPWTSQVDDLRERVRRWTGNHCQLYQVDEQGIATHVRRKAGIVPEWARDSITLFGPDVSHFLARRRTARASSR